jgi:pimeloyl-ACP methyl ester carboxylesterase
MEGRRVRCRVVRPRGNGEGRSTLGLPLLLIHGLACSADAWEPSLRRLARSGVGQPVFAPDMPGYGHSPGPRQALGIDELADWTARLLQTLEVPRAYVAGHSMGCQVALALARRHPARVGGLVLVGPTTGTRLVPFWRYVAGLLADGLRETLRYNITLLRMTAQMGMRRYFATIRKMMKDDPFAHAGEVTAPCLVIRGEHDAIVPEPVAQKLVVALPNGALMTVKGAAHAVQFNKPGHFTRAALAFLSNIILQAVTVVGDGRRVSPQARLPPVEDP